MAYAVIFDMDGVLIDSERISYECFIHSFTKYGYRITDDIFAQMLGKRAIQIKELLKKIYGTDFPSEEIFELRNELFQEYLKNQEIPIKTGVHNLLSNLKKAEIPIAVATSTKQNRAEEFLKRSNLYTYFDFFVYGDQVNETKPNPEIFLKAAAGLKTKPENCFVIEDSKAGIMAGTKANMKVIHVPDLVEIPSSPECVITKTFVNLDEVYRYLLL